MSKIKEFFLEEPDEGFVFKPVSFSPSRKKLKLMNKRQFLGTIIRSKPERIKERWSLLYYEYEKFKHINLDLERDRFNETASSKSKSKLDFIEFVLEDLDTLYEVAQSLFRSEFKAKLKQYLDII